MRYFLSVVAILLSAWLTPLALATDRDLEECKHAKDANRSIAACTRLIESGREVDSAYFYRGMAYDVDKHDHDRAFADFSAAVRIDPTFAPYYLGRGASYLFKGDFNRAIADYTEASRGKPRFRHFLLGETLRAKGDNDRAIALYTTAIARGSRLPYIRAAYFRYRGDAYQAKGDAARALADHKEAIRLDPNVGGH